jgi:ACS family hexuronate transporter-like MFS transporter
MTTDGKGEQDQAVSGFGAPGDWRPWALAATATLGMSVSYIDRQTLAAIAPSVTSALGLDNTQFGWLISAFSMAYLVGAPLSGIVVDRFGARASFVWAVVVWSVVAGAHAFAFSFGTLFTLRVLLGLAEAPSFPSAVQAIRRALPSARRPLAFGLLFTGSSIGAMVAAKLAVRLDAAYGYRGAFAGTAIIGTLWIPFWLLFTRGAGLDRPAARAATTSISWREVALSPAVVRAIVAVVGSAPLLMFVLNWTSKYLVDAWHVPKANVGNLLIWAPLLFDIGAIGFGAIATMRGKRSTTPLVVIATLLATALVLAPLAPSPHAAIAIFAIAASGGGGLYVMITNDMLARVPIERTSAAGGLTAAAQSLAHIIAGPLVGWTIDRTHGHAIALIGLGGIVAPTILVYLLWPGMRAEPTRDA